MQEISRNRGVEKSYTMQNSPEKAPTPHQRLESFSSAITVSNAPRSVYGPKSERKNLFQTDFRPKHNSKKISPRKNLGLCFETMCKKEIFRTRLSDFSTSKFSRKTTRNFMNVSKLKNGCSQAAKGKKRRSKKNKGKASKSPSKHICNPSRASTRPESRLNGAEKIAKENFQMPFDILIEDKKIKTNNANIASVARVSCKPHTKNSLDVKGNKIKSSPKNLKIHSQKENPKKDCLKMLTFVEGDTASNIQSTFSTPCMKDLKDIKEIVEPLSGLLKKNVSILQSSYNSASLKRKLSSANQRVNSVDSRELTLFLAMSKCSSLDEEMSECLDELY